MKVRHLVRGTRRHVQRSGRRVMRKIHKNVRRLNLDWLTPTSLAIIQWRVKVGARTEKKRIFNRKWFDRRYAQYKLGLRDTVLKFPPWWYL